MHFRCLVLLHRQDKMRCSFRRALALQRRSPSHSLSILSHHITSTSPAHNLAYEHSLFQDMVNANPSDQHNLLFWKNNPCVVIGSHQNAWTEANAALLAKHNIQLMRRFSGGGAVYHDNQNLNITFMTPRKVHNPQANAEVIASVLSSQLDIPATVNPTRHDIFVGGEKLSGSAFRLGKGYAYHHCTLLLDADKTMMSSALSSPLADDIQGIGVSSVRSPVTSVSSLSPKGAELMQNGTLSQMLQEAITAAYVESVNASSCEYVSADAEAKAEEYPDLLQKIQSWDWRYGNTPRFTYTPLYTMQRGLFSLYIEARKQATLNCSWSFYDLGNNKPASVVPVAVENQPSPTKCDLLPCLIESLYTNTGILSEEEAEQANQWLSALPFWETA
eukprot:m.279333 g.279333  ORF g.279333 m.279333 type:complete len:389 (+) comp15741_c5_seq1:266-1432(+)